MWVQRVMSAASLAALLACGGSNDINEPTSTQSTGDSDSVPTGGDSAANLHRLSGIGSGDPAAPQTRPAGTLTKICPMGDSITAGDSTHETYRRPLWQSLQNLDANVDFVGSLHDNNTVPPPYTDYDLDNEGHGGIRSDQLADNLPGWMATYDPPDIVLLHIGTNDLGQGRTRDDVFAGISRIIDIVRGRNSHATILLAQIIGMTDEDFNVKARALNAAMPAFADEHATADSAIHLVDQMSTFDPATMTTDGTHPNDQGAQEVASVWLAALRPILGL